MVGIMVMAFLFFCGTGIALGAEPASSQSPGAFEKAESAFGTTDSLQARQIVDKARMTLENFNDAAHMNYFRDYLKDAKAAFVAPSFMKFAFIFGGEGGNGVLLVKDRRNGEWSQPAFYTIGGASVGLQIGGQSSELVLLAMTERGVTALLSSGVNLGVGASLALGPAGMGASAGTVNVSGDIIAFSRAKGAFAGLSLDGSLIKVRNSMNERYYGTNVTPTDILIRRTAHNPHSAGLIAQVTRDTQRAERTARRATARAS
jgi:lipid-binding SYLF domain-containing protein